MSEIERLSEAMRTGSSQMRIAYSREAITSATETPSRRMTASLMFFST